MPSSTPHVLIFIPAKNEAKTIGAIITSLCQLFLFLESRLDILVIDDGSNDETSALAIKAGATVIRHETPQGLGTSFREAQRYALERTYTHLLTIDGDRQFRETDLLTLYQKLVQESFDFISGSRFLPTSKIIHMPASKERGNRLLARVVSSITRRPITDSTCGLRGYSRQALEHLHTFSPFTYTHEVILNLGRKPLRMGEIAIEVEYFSERVSRIAHNLVRYGAKTASILIQSLLLYQPARFFATVALPFFVVGLPPTLFVGIRYILTDFVSPYKSIGIFGLVMIVVGVILLTSGVLLQVLARAQATLEQLLFEERHNRSPRA